MEINIGEKIKEVLNSSEMSIATFAKKIDKERSNIYNIFSRKSIDTDLLKKIGHVLNHDFFQYYILTPSVPPSPISNERKVMISIEFTEKEIMELGLKNKLIEILNK